MNGLELIAPDWRDLVRKHIAEGYELPYEVEALRKDGSIYPASICGRNIPYEGRAVRVTEFRDITERMLAEQQQRIAAIAFESQEGMFITDAEHRIVRANQAFTNITGCIRRRRGKDSKVPRLPSSPSRISERSLRSRKKRRVAGRGLEQAEERRGVSILADHHRRTGQKKAMSPTMSVVWTTLPCARWRKRKSSNSLSSTS